MPRKEKAPHRHQRPHRDNRPSSFDEDPFWDSWDNTKTPFDSSDSEEEESPAAEAVRLHGHLDWGEPKKKTFPFPIPPAMKKQPVTLPVRARHRRHALLPAKESTETVEKQSIETKESAEAPAKKQPVKTPRPPCPRRHAFPLPAKEPEPAKRWCRWDEHIEMLLAHAADFEAQGKPSEATRICHFICFMDEFQTGLVGKDCHPRGVGLQAMPWRSLQVEDWKQVEEPCRGQSSHGGAKDIVDCLLHACTCFECAGLHGDKPADQQQHNVASVCVLH